MRRRDDRRTARRRGHRERDSSPEVGARNQERTPVQSSDLKRLLEGIGTPAPAAFKPDEFQLEALAALEFEDVLVTAPTGSGKTWIAREEIRRNPRLTATCWCCYQNIFEFE